MSKSKSFLSKTYDREHGPNEIHKHLEYRYDALLKIDYGDYKGRRGVSA